VCPASDARPLLRVEDLHVQFPTPSGLVSAVSGLNLHLAEGEMLGIMGEAGSGKSVALNALIRLVRPPGRIRSGHVWFRGRDLLAVSDRDLERIRGREITLIVPNPRAHLNPLVPVGEQIANVLRSHYPVTRGEAWTRAVEILAKVRIGDPERRAGAYPHQLSGGMAQRVVIAMAIVTSPALILADNPTAGLDATIQMQVMDLLHDLLREQRVSMLMVTNELSVIRRQCDRVMFMRGGQIVEELPVGDLGRAEHPYTHALLGSVQSARSAGDRLRLLGGTG
jgi:ABC-type dipeptide/oligopeptide/nickel transport system ATPase component